MENADKQLFRDLIAEIKSSNDKAVDKISKALEELPKGLKDLGKHFEKISQDGQDNLKDTINAIDNIKDNSEKTKEFVEELKDNSDETKKILEEIKDQNSNGAIGIPFAEALNNFNTIFGQTKTLIGDKLRDLIDVNTQSLETLRNLVTSLSGISPSSVTPNSSPSPSGTSDLSDKIDLLRLSMFDLNKTIKDDLVDAINNLKNKIASLSSVISGSPIGSTGNPTGGSTGDPTGGSTGGSRVNTDILNKLGEFIRIISDFKLVPALKTALLLPIFIKMMKKSLTEFSALMNTFNIGIVESVYEQVGDERRETVFSNVGTKIMEGLKLFSEAIESIQKLKIIPLWLSLKFLRYSVIPNLIVSISALGMIDVGAIDKMKNIGESLNRVLSPIAELIQKFGKSLLQSGLALMAIGASIGIFAISLSLLEEFNLPTILTGIGIIASMMGILAFASKFVTGALSSAFALVLIGASLIVFAKGIEMLSNLNNLDNISSPLMIFAGVIMGFAVIATYATGPLLAFSAAIVLLGVGLIAFAMGLGAISAVDTRNIGNVALSLAQLALVLVPLSFFAIPIALTAAGLLVLSGALFVLAASSLALPTVVLFFEQIRLFVEDMDSSKIKDLADSMWDLSKGLVAFSVAAASGLGVGLVTGIASLFGIKGPIEMLKELNELTYLRSVGQGINDIVRGLSSLSEFKSGAFNILNEIPWDKIEDVASELTQGATLQIFAVAKASDINAKELESAGASVNGGTNIVTVVNNSGGNVSNTSVANSNRNIRVNPNIETGSARQY